MGRLRAKAPKQKAVEVPDIDGFSDDGIAVALLRLGPRVEGILRCAHELAQDGFDPEEDELLEDPDGDEEDEEEDGTGEFLGDLLQFLAGQARGKRKR